MEGPEVHWAPELFQMTENDITLPNWGKGISTLHFLLAFQSFQKGDHGWSPPDFGDAMTTDIEPFMMSNPRIIMETLMEQHTQRLPSLIALNRLVWRSRRRPPSWSLPRYWQTNSLRVSFLMRRTTMELEMLWLFGYKSTLKSWAWPIIKHQRHRLGNDFGFDRCFAPLSIGRRRRNSTGTPATRDPLPVSPPRGRSIVAVEGNEPGSNVCAENVSIALCFWCTDGPMFILLTYPDLDARIGSKMLL